MPMPAAGGEGAPLVPMLDWCLFRTAKGNRVLLNLGGIANLTAIPAGAGLDEVVGRIGPLMGPAVAATPSPLARCHGTGADECCAP